MGARELSGGDPGQEPRNFPSRIFLVACLVLSFFLSYLLLQPFLKAIVIAAVLNIVFYPLYTGLVRGLKGRRVLSAVISCVAVILCVVIPLVILAAIFTKQSLELYDFLKAKLESGYFERLLTFHDWGAVQPFLSKYAPWLNLEEVDLRENLLGAVKYVTTSSISAGRALVSNTLSSLGTFALMLFVLFFLFLDGATFVRWAGELVPLPEDRKKSIMQNFVGITKSAVYGSGIVAVLQGILGGMAFWIVGLPAVLWGLVMGFFSLVPVVGTALIWMPASLILIGTGRVGAGIFLLVWGVVVIGTVDNVVRSMLVKGQVRMHTLAIFFAVLGGIKLFGLLGGVFGPLILAMTLSFLHIYRDDFVQPGESVTTGRTT
jgi:predicted PurR-regulated permease PerM